MALADRPWRRLDPHPAARPGAYAQGQNSSLSRHELLDFHARGPEGVETGADETALLGALRYGVGDGKIFCPITAETVEELTKQDARSMVGTMRLVDALSLGVAMVPHVERTAVEFQSLMATVWPSAPALERPVWTAFAFAFGYEDLRPQIDGLVIDDALVCALADKAWNMPPAILAQTMEPNAFEARANSEATATRLNQQNALLADEVGTFENAWTIEIDGACSLMEDIAHHEILRLADAEGHVVDRDSRQTARTISRMIAVSLRNPANRMRFGSLYVPAVLHAAIRAERRKIKPNDIYDFRHAAAALPYCGAFFTDGPLRTLLTSGHTALGRDYDCRIASKSAEALDILKGLCA